MKQTINLPVQLFTDVTFLQLKNISLTLEIKDPSNASECCVKLHLPSKKCTCADTCNEIPRPGCKTTVADGPFQLVTSTHNCSDETMVSIKKYDYQDSNFFDICEQGKSSDLNVTPIDCTTVV